MSKTDMASPTKGLWMRFLLLIPIVIVLAVASYAYIATKAGTYTAVGFIEHDEQELPTCEVTLSHPGVVEVVSVEPTRLGTGLVTFRALADGEVEAHFGTPDGFDIWYLQVKNGAIVEGGINFSGWEAILVSTCVFFASLTALFASAFVKLWRKSWYGYSMVAAGGGMVFSLVQFAVFTWLALFGGTFKFVQFLMTLSSMVDYFMYLTFIPMGILALLVSISNLSLIRHEGLRPVNLLGIAASVAWLALMLINALVSSLGFRLPSGISIYASEVITVAMAFGECLLFSTMMCAWLASRHVPQHGADYLVILGCGIRSDGTPCPLLAGRVQAALDFDVARTRTGDAPATFVPSGGQGPDEPISEAQSMGTYLQDKGVTPERIALEDRSSTTRENMAFSRQVIEKHAGRDVSERSVVFATTNYHVFRGYVCAHMAGMRVEGIGSKTKAYFWPNAFLREFLGLLAHQWPSILQTYVIIVGIYLLAQWILVQL